MSDADLGDACVTRGAGDGCLRYFVPERWNSDPERITKAKVFDDSQVVLITPEITKEEIDRIRAAVRALAAFRQAPDTA